jgi:signal transduction histidine kinase
MVTSSSTVTGFAAFFASLKSWFIAYARWLDSITWKRFAVLSVLALIATALLSGLPPFNVRWGEDKVIVKEPRRIRTVPTPPAAPAAPAVPEVPEVPDVPTAPGASASGISKKILNLDGKRYSIVVDQKGVRIGPVEIDDNGVRVRSASPAASAASSASTDDVPSIRVDLPQGADSEQVRDAIREARDAIREAIEDAKAAADDAKTAAEDAKEAMEDTRPREIRIKAFRLSDHMMGFMVAWIVISVIVKFMAAGRFQAEAQAVVATEMAESEALKRQVVEARMAAMQAQVEPHFLFNTLASIDHLIETDPPRASKMQKNLIALLRASMPTMREANAQGNRDLGRELAVIRPYLEILKVRMEERLSTEIRVSDGLLSAEFPQMMLQSLVENAIKHGLEPKAEGGTLSVAAEIVHGKLAVTVADTGLGFGKAATAGTGIGLANIRERLQLLYGAKASLTVAENPGGGTAVTITVPYTSHSGDKA